MNVAKKELLNLLPLKKPTFHTMKRPVKILIWILGILTGIALLFYFVARPILINNTKKHSPEQHITFEHPNNDLELKAFYCSPSKKGREIFGELVPYGEVWRTGANEATTITTNKDLVVGGTDLSAGTYTLWTITNEATWDVIFNSKMYGWGVSMGMEASREAEYDVAVATVDVATNYAVTEDFTISFSESGANTVMLLSWDHVVVAVPLSVK